LTKEKQVKQKGPSKLIGSVVKDGQGDQNAAIHMNANGTENSSTGKARRAGFTHWPSDGKHFK
jgi:hypothetical protein